MTMTSQMSKHQVDAKSQLRGFMVQILCFGMPVEMKRCVQIRMSCTAHSQSHQSACLACQILRLDVGGGRRPFDMAIFSDSSIDTSTFAFGLGYGDHIAFVRPVPNDCRAAALSHSLNFSFHKRQINDIVCLRMPGTDRILTITASDDRQAKVRLRNSAIVLPICFSISHVVSCACICVTDYVMGRCKHSLADCINSRSNRHDSLPRHVSMSCTASISRYIVSVKIVCASRHRGWKAASALRSRIAFAD